MYIKEEKKKKDSKRKRIRSKNYFHISICVRNKFDKNSSTSYSLVDTPSRSVFKYVYM